MQKGNGRPTYEPMNDSTVIENDDKFSKRVIALMEEINKNGLGDVAKCFIPRHTIKVYQNQKLVYNLLVCFECEGFRLYDNKNTDTGFCKSYKKRLAQLDKVSAIFTGRFKSTKNSIKEVKHRTN